MSVAAPGAALTDEVALEAARRRARWVLMAGAALGSTSVIVAATVSVIAARDMLQDAALAGAAGSTIIVGAALGTSSLATLMTRRGRRFGLSLGHAVAFVGGLLAAWSVIVGSFPALLAGTLMIGFANSSSQLSRYVSADMAAPARRAWAIGLVVWAATVGAVAGPVLLPVSASLAETFGLPGLAGPFMAPGILGGIAALLLAALLRPDPDALVVVDGDGSSAPVAAAPMGRILRRPAVSIALVAMLVGQVVMVTIMAMTPLHMTDHGHSLAAVGVVISAHVLGMFALSPLSGRIADSVGSLRTILLGAGVLAVASLLAAAAPPDGGSLLLVALFLLGVGWNLGFVAGSALLTSALAPSERTRAHGFTDSLVWGSSAVASLASGLILAGIGFAALGVIGLMLLILPVWAVFWLRGVTVIGADGTSADMDVAEERP